MRVVTGLLLLHLHQSPLTQGEELAFLQSEAELKNRMLIFCHADEMVIFSKNMPI